MPADPWHGRCTFMREYTVVQRGCTIALNTRAREEENMVDVTTRAKETLAQMNPRT